MEIILIWLILVVAVTVLAVKKGRSGLVWFLAAAVLSPLVGLILLALPKIDKHTAEQPR